MLVRITSNPGKLIAEFHTFIFIYLQEDGKYLLIDHFADEIKEYTDIVDASIQFEMAVMDLKEEIIESETTYYVDDFEDLENRINERIS